MITIIIATVVATVLCAILYRLGGLGDDYWMRHSKYPRFLFNTKMRDFGVPLVCVAWMTIFTDVPLWVALISSVAMFGALTTYWDEIFGRDQFWFHGFVIGLSYVAYAVYLPDMYVHWLMIRALVIAFTMSLVCMHTENDWVEELSRGTVIAATLPLLLI